MLKSLITLTLGVAISACATYQAASSAEAPQTAEAQAQAQTQNRRVCETVEDEATGTKIARRQECRDVVDEEARQPKAN
jgi:flagellar motility protein MotE (MotC chaperone)